MASRGCRTLIILLIVIFASKQLADAAERKFSFASYFETNMVLQMAPARASVWGYAASSDIGETVVVQMSSSSNAQSYITNVVPGAGQGVWKVLFDPVADVQHVYTVKAVLKSETPIILSNVLFGDVWICSGQSNMKLPVAQIFNASKEASEASRFSNIRFFSVAQVQSTVPLFDIPEVEIHWSLPNAKTVKPFSAVCWLYAKYIYEKRGVPMGLVETSWGGTNIEAWSSPDSLHACKIPSDGGQKLRQIDKNVYLQRIWLDDFDIEQTPNSVLWNSMVHPLLNMTIYGVIWYQGESNTAYNRDLYKCTFSAMITDWRQKWYIGTDANTQLFFPFGFIQIGPTDGKPVIAGYADIRWHQTADVGYTPNSFMQNVFMAVAFDLTDKVGLVHYRDKETISWRLSLSGLAVAYNHTVSRYQGPYPMLVKLDRALHMVTVEYDDGKTSLIVNARDGFEVCCKNTGCPIDGADWLPARVDSDKRLLSAVRLNVSDCSDMSQLTGLRYGWRETPFQYLRAAVYSEENNLPAPPFVTFFRVPELLAQQYFVHRMK